MRRKGMKKVEVVVVVDDRIVWEFDPMGEFVCFKARRWVMYRLRENVRNDNQGPYVHGFCSGMLLICRERSFRGMKSVLPLSHASEVGLTRLLFGVFYSTVTWNNTSFGRLRSRGCGMRTSD
jgi:hypothetical protein